MLSLLELSIVLTFFSAITLTVINSNFLITKGDNILLVAEYNNLNNAIGSFHNTYKFMPGDFPFADKYFAYGFSGNGDNIISDHDESLIAWEHLELADLIKNSYEFQELGYAKIGVNMKPSKHKECGYQILTDKKLNNINYSFDERYVFLRLAASRGRGNLTKSCLNAEQAFFLDSKIDDGLPLSGKLFADNGHELQSKDNPQICLCEDEKGEVTYCNYNESKTCIAQLKNI